MHLPSAINTFRFRLALVVGDPVLKRGLTLLLREFREYQLSAECFDVSELIKRDLCFDIIILDPGARLESGLRAVSQIRQHFRNIPIIMLGTFEEEAYSRWMQETGLLTYIPKPFSAERLREAISDRSAYLLNQKPEQSLSK